MKKKIIIIAVTFCIIAGMMIPVVLKASLVQYNEQPTIKGSIEANGCIFGNFVLREDWETLATLTLQKNCEFYLVDHKTNEDLEGTYSMSNEIKCGTTSELTFYVDGKSIGGGTLAWPTEGPMCVYINGLRYEKY